MSYISSCTEQPKTINTSCYYVNLGKYTKDSFGRVAFNPPLSNPPPYKCVSYNTPNYDSLTRKSVDTVCGYSSINNAYISDNCNQYYTNKCNKL